MKRFLTGMFRNMKRNLLFSVINLSGLILGFVCIIIIALWIKNELSYDNFHRNSQDIYRVHRYFYDPNGAENLHLPYVAPIIAPLMEKEFSEIASYCQSLSYRYCLFFKQSETGRKEALFCRSGNT